MKKLKAPPSTYCCIILVAVSILNAIASVQAQGIAKTRKATKQVPIVLFVCEHGSAQSVIAAAHFNNLARKRNLNLRAISRGTNPDQEIAPKAAEGYRPITLLSVERSQRDCLELMFPELFE